MSIVLSGRAAPRKVPSRRSRQSADSQNSRRNRGPGGDNRGDDAGTVAAFAAVTMRVLLLVPVLLATSACLLTPNQDDVLCGANASVTFSGYTNMPGQTVYIQTSK